MRSLRRSIGMSIVAEQVFKVTRKRQINLERIKSKEQKWYEYIKKVCTKIDEEETRAVERLTAEQVMQSSLLVIDANIKLATTL
ncbi:hypothetical protein J6590_059964 [Homalodisca vitripennis]|nr:hypothetical protein J6590_059964 [Homalodisca vitripennis]